MLIGSGVKEGCDAEPYAAGDHGCDEEAISMGDSQKDSTQDGCRGRQVSYN